MLSAYKNTAYVLLGGALCKAWQLIFSCFSLCALVKRCFHYKKYFSCNSSFMEKNIMLFQDFNIRQYILYVVDSNGNINNRLCVN